VYDGAISPSPLLPFSALTKIAERLRLGRRRQTPCKPCILYRTEERCDSEQRTIRAEVSAPEVLNEHGQKDQQTNDDCRCRPDIAKEVQHLHISNQAIRRCHEVVDCLGGHGADQEHKETKKQVLQPSKREIEPFRWVQIAAECAFQASKDSRRGFQPGRARSKMPS
jgi:hypothetical protein